MGTYEVGASVSQSSGAESGNYGDFNVTTGGGRGAGLLPTLTPDKAWIGWAIGGVVVVLIAALFFKFKFGK